MPSFDIVCEVDLQEADNAINGILRELTNRYDFKGAQFSIELDKKDNKIVINAPDEYKLTQIQASLKAHFVKRNIDPRTLDFQKEEAASNNSFRQSVKIKQGIDQETAKKITKDIKSKKFKVQASIRGEEVRVEGKKRDDLQTVMSDIKATYTDLAVQFINFRD